MENHSELSFTDVIILSDLLALEAALMKARDNVHLCIRSEELLQNVQQQIALLVPRIREKMNKKKRSNHG